MYSDKKKSSNSAIKDFNNNISKIYIFVEFGRFTWITGYMYIEGCELT